MGFQAPMGHQSSEKREGIGAQVWGFLRMGDADFEPVYVEGKFLIRTVKLQ